jgi:hypothetical protein
MADDYLHVMTRAIGAPARRISLPAHLRDDGSARGRELAAALGVGPRIADVFPG